MQVFRGLTLRQLLTLPYVVLVLVLTLVLGVLSYRAGRSTVDTLSAQYLSEMASRVSQAVQMQVFGSKAVLDAAFPRGVTAPADLAQQQDILRQRFWVATSIHRPLNNYVYYGDEQGRFLGLWRNEDDTAQLRLRLKGDGLRSLFVLPTPDAKVDRPSVEQKIFEPRLRPWYHVGRDAQREAWSPIYIDFRTRELVATLARPVHGSDGKVAGVVATDVSLQQLNDFMRSLRVSDHGLAYVVERDGHLIATSRGAYLKGGVGVRASVERLNAMQSPDVLLRTSFDAAKQHFSTDDSSPLVPRSAVVRLPNGELVQQAMLHVRDGVNLDWYIVIAVPRDDFLQGVTQNAINNALLGGVAVLLVLGIGWWSLSNVTRDLGKITQAADAMRQGHFDSPVEVSREDEIGALARSFLAMKQRIATDRVTGLMSRDALLQRLEDRLLHQRRRGDNDTFALIYLGIRGLRDINEQHGHEVGDELLTELGTRLRQALREDDLIGRLAGDEFLILLSNTATASAVQAVQDKLRAALAQPLRKVPAGAQSEVTVAMGVSVFPYDGEDVPSLLNHADLALHRDGSRGAA
jgi:diguanylate cyclase (GGDEF)-like protein